MVAMAERREVHQARRPTSNSCGRLFHEVALFRRAMLDVADGSGIFFDCALFASASSRGDWIPFG